MKECYLEIRMLDTVALGSILEKEVTRDDKNLIL
jgi:hypothetical protein